MSLIKARSTSINLTSDPNTLGMATGTTAQRNPNAIEGEVRFNTDLQQLEYFDGFFWNQTSLVSGSASFEYLVVGGGGSGGGWGGGGGAGGFLTGTFIPNQGTIYSITVGLGATATPYGTNYQQGNDGQDSSISGTGITTITAIGGGGGGSYSSGTALAGNSGGSGGGAGARGTAYSGASGGAGTSGQGFAGGNTSTSGNYYPGAGGGGGAGQVGSNGSGNQGGTGGDGLQSSITGVSKYYAGGGGGHSSRTSLDPGAAGGQGGGGTGGRYQNSSSQISERAAVSGTNGLGGGGGGGFGYGSYPVGNGGRGTVIIKSNVALTTTGTFNLNPDGAVAGFFIYEFTSNGTITF